MARKKKKSAAKRVGAGRKGIKSALVTYAPIIGGVAGLMLGDKVNAFIDSKVGTNIDTKIIAAGEVGIGALLVFNKKMKNPIARAAGGFAMGVGAKRAMKAFGIGGYQAVLPVNGFYNVKSVNGAKQRHLGAFTPGGGGMSFNSRSSMSGRQMMNSSGGSMMR